MSDIAGTICGFGSRERGFFAVIKTEENKTTYVYVACVSRACYTGCAFAAMIDVREKSEGIHRRWHSAQPSQKILPAVSPSLNSDRSIIWLHYVPVNRVNALFRYRMHSEKCNSFLLREIKLFRWMQQLRKISRDIIFFTARREAGETIYAKMTNLFVINAN